MPVAPDSASPALGASQPHPDHAADEVKVGDSSARHHIERLTRWVDDFPTPGVKFADLTPVFANTEGFAAIVDEVAGALGAADLIAAIDARGFMIGGAVAHSCCAGVLAVRKAGKLPPPVYEAEYKLEYGSAKLEIPAAGIDLVGKRVLIVDDVMATGGTVGAACKLLEKAGAKVEGIAVVLELKALGGRARLPYPLTSLAVV
jgi:adenine phosphoribosyltransferase